jgi:hypothetical protein
VIISPKPTAEGRLMDGKPRWSVTAIVAGFVAVLVAPGSMVLASNIGWKINLPLVNGFVAPGPKGDNWIGVGPVSPYVTYSNLCSVFAAAGATKANISLAQINPSTGVITSFNCALAGGTAFAPGWGIRVRITGSVFPSSPNHIVLVGASGNLGGTIFFRPQSEVSVDPHNHAGVPTIIGGFIAPGPKGDNWIYPPITTRWIKSSDVCTSLGARLADAVSIAYVRSSDGATLNHTCGLATNDFNLAGTAIRIRKATTGDLDPSVVGNPQEWPVY